MRGPVKFHLELAASTICERQRLLSAPAIQGALLGDITHTLYLAFLSQAYQHVRHTVPLMMAVSSRLPVRMQWLQEHIVHYIEDEIGHEHWILNDIDAAGGDRIQAAASPPAPATDAMVAYAYDTVMRRNPVGFFGMVHVLEGTSAAIALHAADRIQAALDLPAQALTYLRSHGHADQQHVHHLATILNRLEHPDDRSAVLQCARAIYWLYGEMFRSLDAPTSSTADR